MRHRIAGMTELERPQDDKNLIQRVDIAKIPACAGMTTIFWISANRPGVEVVRNHSGSLVLMVLQALVRARCTSELTDFCVHKRFFSSSLG